LVDFQSHITEFDNRNVNVIAASTDKLEEAREIVAKYNLTFPIAYGLNAKEVSAITGSFFDEEKGYLHATSFIIRPDGVVREAVYSTGPVGRFTASDCIGMIDFLSRSK